MVVDEDRKRSSNVTGLPETFAGTATPAWGCVDRTAAEEETLTFQLKEKQYKQQSSFVLLQPHVLLLLQLPLVPKTSNLIKLVLELFISTHYSKEAKIMFDAAGDDEGEYAKQPNQTHLFFASRLCYR